MPCLAGKCAADNARARLASGAKLQPLERADLEAAATGCDGEQPDPWNATLKWQGCPAKRAMEHPDIDAALTLRGLSKMATLANWPRCANGRVVEVWTMIDAERAALQTEREARR